MTNCKHFTNRIVKVVCGEAISKPTGYYSILLVKNDYCIFMINKEKYFLSGSFILCLNELDSVELIYSKSSSVYSISFSPEFINTNLDVDTVKSANYTILRKMHNYPYLDFFLYRSSFYFGVIPIKPNVADRMYSLLKIIDNQVRKQPDLKWSCRARMNLFLILNIIENYYKNMIHIDGQENELVRDVIAYIQVNITENMKLEQVCELFNTNHTTLNRKFKQAMGTTVIDYIIDHKIFQSKLVLSFTDLSIHEISNKFGFKEQTYYAKLFKQKTGTTPLRYRKQTRDLRPTRTRV